MNRKRSVPIDVKKLQNALDKKGMTRKEAAEIVGLTEAAFRKAVNTFQRLQPDQILKLAETLEVNPSFFTKEKIHSITVSDSVYSASGKLLAEKGDVISIPVIGSDNYKEWDLQEWNESMNSLLTISGIGERLHKMKKEERGTYVTFIQAWILEGNKYYGLLNDDQIDLLLESFEAMADKMISKNKQSK